MKRIVLLVLTIILAFSPVYAINPQVESTNFFGGGYFLLSGIDTDGTIFSAVIDGQLAVSDDFEIWESVDGVSDIAFTVFLQDRLCAVGVGHTYVYDGIKWIEHDNNICGKFYNYNINMVKNGKSLVAYIPDMGTYQTFDGIKWNKVENIPDNAKMYKINDKIMFFSLNYMYGLYYSDTGESFVHQEFGADKPQTVDVIYNDGMYYMYDYRDEDGVTHLYEYSSKNLENWSMQEIEVHFDPLPLRSSFVNINGEMHALSINGDDHVFKDGKWVTGQYDMNAFTAGKAATAPFVSYNFSDFGIFAWGTDNRAYFIDNSGNVRSFDGKSRIVAALSVKDGDFYAASTDGTLWKSKDGIKWDKSGIAAEEDYKYLQTKATNGSVTIDSEFIERGSRRFYEGNPEITASLTYPDGRVEKVAYEYAKDDYVTIIGGNGFFLIGGFDFQNTLYFSRDGITRGEPVLASERIVSNGDRLVFSDLKVSAAKLSQFEELAMPESILVKLNGEYLSFATAPVVQNGTTLIPIRFLFERAGANVEWNPYSEEVTVTYGENSVKLAIGSDVAYVNGREERLSAAAQLINDKTLIPLRFISENLGFDVLYDEAEHTAIINTKF